jgi:hypothetical protein
MLPSLIIMKKLLVEQCDRLHIHDVKAAIPYHAQSATLEVGTQVIQVTGRLTNLKNGYRYCFVCIGCRKPYETLYRTDFGEYSCRKCIGLVYWSTRK